MGIATASVSASNIPTQIGSEDPQGEVYGVLSTSLISFHGATPSAQASGPGQAALTRGQACGAITTYATTQSPSSVATITSGEKDMTVAGATNIFAPATTDFVYVNKPTSQAGLGMGNVRVKSANVVSVTFSNFTAATLTPTASEVYTIVALRGFGALSATLTPAAVLANTITEQLFTVAGVRSGTKALVQVLKPTAQAGLDIMGCRVVADNVIGITFGNVTAATLTPTAAESYTVLEIAGLDAVTNLMEIGCNISTALAAGVATITVAEIAAITCTNLATTDTVMGVSKPTQQAGLGIAGYRVSAANALRCSFVNPTAATLTPTASEVYGVTIFRPAPVAPLVVYSQALTPVAVAANTTAEQTFTVTGLVASSPVWVNKPSSTLNLGIVGVRVSALNTLAINYGNSSAASITPPVETYVIGNFQIATPDAGSSWSQTASLAAQNNTILSNAMRAALVTKGLIAGA